MSSNLGVAVFLIIALPALAIVAALVCGIVALVMASKGRKQLAQAQLLLADIQLREMQLTEMARQVQQGMAPPAGPPPPVAQPGPAVPYGGAPVPPPAVQMAPPIEPSAAPTAPPAPNGEFSAKD